MWSTVDTVLLSTVERPGHGNIVKWCWDYSSIYEWEGSHVKKYSEFYFEIREIKQRKLFITELRKNAAKGGGVLMLTRSDEMLRYLHLQLLLPGPTGDAAGDIELSTEFRNTIFGGGRYY